MTVYRALEMVAAPTEPGKSPSITVTLHLTIGNFQQERPWEKARARTYRGNAETRLTPWLRSADAITSSPSPTARNLTIPISTAEVNHLQVEMLNIAEGYRCSIETDIREVGGAERVW